MIEKEIDFKEWIKEEEENEKLEKMIEKKFKKKSYCHIGYWV